MEECVLMQIERIILKGDTARGLRLLQILK
jgi:hypothetical protein